MVVRKSCTNSEGGDLLTKYNGTTITYDEIGNPLTYYNGSAYTFTWTGRQLTGAVKGSNNLTFVYNDEGIRTSKTVNGVKHTYYLNGSQIVAEQWSNKLIVYLYDSTGMPIGMMYRTTSYAVNQWDVFWYEKNLQGDVVAIYNSSGTKVATYTYTDAWGSHSVSYTNGGGSTGAQYNPFRYRGYYYDADLGMYYLQSRYYDPNTCRFINAEPNVYVAGFDTGAGLIGYNVYIYCANNPINYFDPTGEVIISTLILCMIAGAVVVGVVGGIAGSAYADSKGYTEGDKINAILTGVAIGGFCGGALGYFIAPSVVSITGVAGISITANGVSTIAATGTTFGTLGTLIENNGNQIIDWNNATIHGLQRMLERGVSQTMVESWVKTGKALQQTGDKIIYITKQGAVVINNLGQVITAYTSKYFDASMQKIIERLFGK